MNAMNLEEWISWAHSGGAVEYITCISAEELHLPTTNALDMTLNNLMLRLKKSCSFEECRVPLCCHHSQVHFSLSMDQIELFDI